MKFGPINLWSRPNQSLYNEIVLRKHLNMIEDSLVKARAEIRRDRLKRLENLYYLRTGKIV